MGSLPPFPPFLEDAVDHARRFILLLEALEPSSVRRPAKMWLEGRIEEVRCVVDAVTADWQFGHTSTAEAAQSLNMYLQGLHKGLAVHFGELAPSCCVCSLVVTATPVSLVPGSKAPAPKPKWRRELMTTPEVGEGELLAVTALPRSS
jgi:hypothetical protein